jgi:hypothetical protein
MATRAAPSHFKPPDRTGNVVDQSVLGFTCPHRQPQSDSEWIRGVQATANQNARPSILLCTWVSPLTHPSNRAWALEVNIQPIRTGNGTLSAGRCAYREIRRHPDAITGNSTTGLSSNNTLVASTAATQVTVCDWSDFLLARRRRGVCVANPRQTFQNALANIYKQ